MLTEGAVIHYFVVHLLLSLRSHMLLMACYSNSALEAELLLSLWAFYGSYQYLSTSQTLIHLFSTWEVRSHYFPFIVMELNHREIKF